MLAGRSGSVNVDVAERPVLLRCFFFRRPKSPILFEWECEGWMGRRNDESAMYGMATIWIEVCCVELVNEICFPLLTRSGQVVTI